MATSEKLASVMTAESENEKYSGDYYVYRKAKSYRIVTPLSTSHTCHSLVKDENGVKSEILLIFKAKVIKVTPSVLLS